MTAWNSEHELGASKDGTVKRWGFDQTNQGWLRGKQGTVAGLVSIPPLMRSPASLSAKEQSHAAKCGLTLRSSRLAPAWHLAREAASLIFGLAGQAPHLRSRLSSNVRLHTNLPWRSTSASLPS